MLSCLFCFFCSHLQLLLGLYVVQGMLGLLLFEWAWKQVERVRVDASEEAMHVEFPSFRRPDTHLWRKSNYYLGAFLFLVPRAIWAFFWFFAVGFVNMISYWG